MTYPLPKVSNRSLGSSSFLSPYRWPNMCASVKLEQSFPTNATGRDPSLMGSTTSTCPHVPFMEPEVYRMATSAVFKRLRTVPVNVRSWTTLGYFSDLYCKTYASMYACVTPGFFEIWQQLSPWTRLIFCQISFLDTVDAQPEGNAGVDESCIGRADLALQKARNVSGYKTKFRCIVESKADGEDLILADQSFRGKNTLINCNLT